MHRTVRDPVCGMGVVTGVALHVDHHGRWYFCSESCRSRFLADPDHWVRASAGIEERPETREVAWFSMEIALSDRIHTYAGGLGVLGGDLLRAAADLHMPLVAVTLASTEGYFRQHIGVAGQIEAPDPWNPEEETEHLDVVVEVEVARRTVRVGAWRAWVVDSGTRIPVLLLDTDRPDNDERDRSLTRRLYQGDARHRLGQEIVLGIGGARMLRALGCTSLRRWHMNEGHSALLAVELLRTLRGADGTLDFDAVRNRCVFTTHTPVAAGHDQFEWDLVDEVLGEPVPKQVLRMLGGDERLNMTRLALHLSHFVNGVARRHQEVASSLLPTADVESITNGVHSTTWTSPPFAELFDRRIRHWRADPQALRGAVSLSDGELWDAHDAAKHALVAELDARCPGTFSAEVFTIGFARRATAYKRPELVLADPDRLRAIANMHPIQIVFAGKAHPDDAEGKARILEVERVAQTLGRDVPMAWIEEYDMALARLLTSGVDLWLNTPQPPLEASGTSGMKAAHNGVPQLSVADGWWVEGCIEGITGWMIESGNEPESLYRKLESRILPAYSDRHAWAAVMRGAIAFSASYFNAHRMVGQYAASAWM